MGLMNGQETQTISELSKLVGAGSSRESARVQGSAVPRAAGLRWFCGGFAVVLRRFVTFETVTKQLYMLMTYTHTLCWACCGVQQHLPTSFISCHSDA